MNLKYISIIAVTVIIAVFFFMHQSNKADTERLEQAKKQAQREESTSKLVAIGVDKQVAGKVIEAQSVAGQIKKLDATQVKEFEQLISEWQDADKIAGLTARMALAQPVSHLQDVKRKLDGVVYTGCLESTRLLYVSAMNSGIDSYYEFMRGSDNEVATSLKIQDYQKQLKRSEKEYELCKSFMDR